MAGILGRKIGMTNIFDNNGRVVPVTLIEAGPCFVVALKTKEKDGYAALALGYGEVKEKKVTKPQKGIFDKIKITPKKIIKEIRLKAPTTHKIGDEIGVNVFKVGDYIDVSGRTIGKGFQGGMKRWNWSGGQAGHGSMFHRAVGSIGASSYPSRVHKGKTMPGHMGAVMRTVQSLEVMDVDAEKKLLAVRGSVSGHKDTLLFIRHAKKRSRVEVKGDKAKKDDKKAK